jgi:hypothetical protein
MNPMKAAVCLFPVLMLGCHSAAAQTTGLALKVSGVIGRDGVPKSETVFSATDFASLARIKTSVLSRDGKERVYEGVLLSDILKRAGQPLSAELRGGAQLTRYIIASAHDGYRVLFSLPEIDPLFNDSSVIVADTVDGKPLADREGPLRLIVPHEKREARWLRMLEKIEIQSAPEPIR